MKKGDIYEGIIENYDFPNKGSLVAEDRKVVIKGALKGQKVRFMITKKKSGIAEGRLLEVLGKSPLEDYKPACPYFGLCGGCTYQNLSVNNQLKLKEEMVKKLLSPVIMDGMGADIDSVWDGVFSSPDVLGYRNKMEFTFGDEYKDGPLALGLHKKGGFYDILNVPDCKIIGADWRIILEYTLDYFRKMGVPFYHKMKHEGILRNLVIRQSKGTGEFLINLVAASQWDRYGYATEPDTDDNGTQSRKFPGSKIIMEYAEGLLKAAENFSEKSSVGGIIYTENDSLGDVVQSDRSYTLFGRDYITEDVMGLKFKISPFSFFQTNTKGCEVLYDKAREYILSGSIMSGDSLQRSDRVVFDLYSGTGTIAQMMASVAKKVIGIEIVGEAVEAARENAKLNGLSNCEFIAGDVLKAIDLIDEKPDIIILDPPRDGINPKALEKILAFGVDEMIYISCKPTSLARDLRIILNNGYRVEKVAAVDQFPMTVHVETVCLLSRKAQV